MKSYTLKELADHYMKSGSNKGSYVAESEAKSRIDFVERVHEESMSGRKADKERIAELEREKAELVAQVEVIKNADGSFDKNT